jgi:hypothetical protein
VRGVDRRDWAVGQGIERGQTQSGEGTSGNRSQQKRGLGHGHVVVYNHEERGGEVRGEEGEANK